MITLRVEKRYGTATVKVRVIAPSIEQALKLYGEEAEIVSQAQPTRFLSLEGPAESIEQIPVEVGERSAEAA